MSAKLNVIGVSALAMIGVSACKHEKFTSPRTPTTATNYSITASACEAGVAMPSPSDNQAGGSVTISFDGNVSGTCSANFIGPFADCLDIVSGVVSGNSITLTMNTCLNNSSGFISGSVLDIIVTCDTTPQTTPDTVFAAPICIS